MTTESCDLVTRRQFIVGLGASMLLVACSGRTVSIFQPDTTLPSLDPSAAAPPGSLGPATDKVLVVVEMGGGNDGLNMVVPHASDAYYDIRSNIAVASPIGRYCGES